MKHRKYISPQTIFFFMVIIAIIVVSLWVFLRRQRPSWRTDNIPEIPSTAVTYSTI